MVDAVEDAVVEFWPSLRETREEVSLCFFRQSVSEEAVLIETVKKA